jgi:hypothetical protein
MTDCPQCTRSPIGICHKCAMLYTGGHTHAVVMEYILGILTPEGHCLRSHRAIADTVGCDRDIVLRLLYKLCKAGI